MKTKVQQIDEIVEAQHKEILRKVLEPYMGKSSTEPTYFFNYEQYKAYNEAIEAEIKPYIKIKDPSLPRGNNFTPKKKKRK